MTRRRKPKSKKRTARALGIIPGRLVKPIPVQEFLARLTSCFTDVEDPAASILLREILSKYDDGDKSQRKIRRARALTNFHKVESRMGAVNGRLAPRSIPSSEWVVNGIIYNASQKIARVLPQPNVLLFARCTERAAFGPGSTLNLRNEHGDHYYKVIKPEVTLNARDFFTAALVDRQGWFNLLLEDGGLFAAHGSRVTTVAKDSEKDRTIAIEPSGNMFLQKGIGAVIRKSLKRVGVDLDDQSINQAYARVGSLFDNLATIDLSAASDSVSYWLVRRLLPPDWFNALELVRCHRGVLDGKEVRFQKFSSMGNGYTFELESLIFWALARATLEYHRFKDTRLSIYGDDIIMSSEAVPAFKEVLDYVGFQLNEKKTHVSGPYRESCGKHYWNGRDVSPFYIRKPIDDHASLFLLHNNVRRWAASQRAAGVVKGEVLHQLLCWLRGHAVPDWSHPRIPDKVGDGAFIGSFDEVLPTLTPLKHGHEGFTALVISESKLSFDRRDNAGLIAQLMQWDQPSHRLDYLEPRVVSKIRYGSPVRKVGRLRVLQWDDVF